eukprot:CAMPEP_0173325068 /NCGR_PEP_ID=MMETSP1144-20121109/289_1 /TAXON_ID=483371 /ORGANISM="non described non described, Strain CCMP2298" /LENGTH=229 /DNA_ID=CAMNT_0014269195 /DNA_START=25 /DNA_END=714 /DNA_ORIENTATION=-
MGSGSSVLSPELAGKLEPQNLEKFYQLRSECAAQDMGAGDTYSHMTILYNEMLTEQDEKKALEDGTANLLVREMSTEHKFEVEAFLRELKETLDEKDQALFNLTAGDDFNSFTVDTVKKIFLVDDDKLHKPDKHKLLPQEVHEGEFNCHLCSTFFDSRHDMDLHVDHSDMHRRSLALRAHKIEEAHKEALRLTTMARSIMSSMYQNAGEHLSALPARRSLRHAPKISRP